MAIVRTFGNSYTLTDFTEEVNYIPNVWGTINDLGIFNDVPVAEHSVTFEEADWTLALVGDRIRGDRNNVNKDTTRKLHSFIVPHFPLDDQILPKDIQGVRAYGSATEAETLDAVRMRKMTQLKMRMAATLEYARAQALTVGTVYSPNGTVSQNWFTEFGVTQTTVDFTFGTSTADMLANTEKAIAAIQDNAGSVTISGIVALCSPGFFGKLIAHPSIKTAYQYYASTQSPLRNRMSQGIADSAVPLHREFDFQGVRYIEMRDQYNGSVLIPANTATFVPTGTNYFNTYFGPAERFGLTNTLGEAMYYFEQANPNGTAINIETESNFVNAIMKPALVVQGFSSN